jgi:hypothetical protein
MPRIRCRYEDCVFLEDGYCGAAAIELEPDTGCLTYTRVDDAEEKEDEEWEEEEVDELDEEDDDYFDGEDEDDDWDEDDDDY